MKRYVKEFANDMIKSARRINNPIKKLIVTRIQEVYKAYERGLITEKEAIEMILNA